MEQMWKWSWPNSTHYPEFISEGTGKNHEKTLGQDGHVFSLDTQTYVWQIPIAHAP